MIDPKTIVINEQCADGNVVGMIDQKVSSPEILNLRETCTKEEAVAMMLGWMQGCVRPKYIYLTEGRIPEDQLLVMHSLDGSVQDHIADLRAAAYQAFLDAHDACAPDDVLEEKNQAIIKCDDLSNKAWSYLMDIADEIAKGDSSALRIDRDATENSGAIQYTLRSIDEWARKKHSISIFEPSKPSPLGANTPMQQENEVEPEKGLSKTKSDNLYLTFAFLVEAFSESAPKYKGPNVATIAAHLESLALAANSKETLSGQKTEAIKDRIEAAMSTKRKTLPNSAK